MVAILVVLEVSENIFPQQFKYPYCMNTPTRLILIKQNDLILTFKKNAQAVLFIGAKVNPFQSPGLYVLKYIYLRVYIYIYLTDKLA